MKVPGVSARERMALAIGGACIVTIFAAARGVPALLAWRRDLHSVAEENRSALSDARAVLAEERRVHDGAQADGNRVIALAPLLLSGDTPASASATLEGIISGAAAASNVQLGALELRSDSTSRTAFTRIVVKGSANGDIHGLSQMLQLIEQGPALLAVEELSITQPELVAAPDHMESLHMELVVGGLMLTPQNAVRAK
jgi:hypothetical protein